MHNPQDMHARPRRWPRLPTGPRCPRRDALPSAGYQASFILSEVITGAFGRLGGFAVEVEHQRFGRRKTLCNGQAHAVIDPRVYFGYFLPLPGASSGSSPIQTRPSSLATGCSCAGFSTRWQKTPPGTRRRSSTDTSRPTTQSQRASMPSCTILWIHHPGLRRAAARAEPRSASFRPTAVQPQTADPIAPAGQIAGTGQARRSTTDNGHRFGGAKPLTAGSCRPWLTP